MGIFGRRKSKSVPSEVSYVAEDVLSSIDGSDWPLDPQAARAFHSALVPEGVVRLWESGNPGGLLAVLADTAEPGFHRRWAAVALGRLGDAAAVPGLVAVLPDLEVRGYAALALGMIGDPRAVGPLRMQISANPMVEAKLSTAVDALYRRSPAKADAALSQFNEMLDEAAHRFGRECMGLIDEHPRCPICDSEFRSRLEHCVWCRECNVYIAEEGWWPGVACTGEKFGQLLSEQRYGFIASVAMFATWGFTDRSGRPVSMVPPPVCLVFRMQEDYRVPDGCSVGTWNWFMERVAVSWNQAGDERDRRMDADLLGEDETA